MTKDKRKIKENIYKKLNKDPKELLAYIEEKLSKGSYPSLTFISVCASIPAEKYLPYDKYEVIKKVIKQRNNYMQEKAKKDVDEHNKNVLIWIGLFVLLLILSLVGLAITNAISNAQCI